MSEEVLESKLQKLGKLAKTMQKLNLNWQDQNTEGRFTSGLNEKVYD